MPVLGLLTHRIAVQEENTMGVVTAVFNTHVIGMMSV